MAIVDVTAHFTNFIIVYKLLGANTTFGPDNILCTSVPQSHRPLLEILSGFLNVVSCTTHRWCSTVLESEKFDLLFVVKLKEEDTN